jgi:hypothetical protein
MQAISCSYTLQKIPNDNLNAINPLPGHLCPEFSAQPPVHHLERRLRLVKWHHVSTSMNLQESEVAVRLDLTNLLAIAVNLEVLHLGLLELLLTGPLKCLSPGLVAEPVADVVGITSVDEDWDLLENTGNNAVVWLHPVSLQKEVAVDVKVARVIGRNFGTDSLHDLLLVEVGRDPVNFVVAELVVATWPANIINVLASALVGANHGIVAVDGGRHARPDRLGVVAVLDQASAARVGVVHGRARAHPHHRPWGGSTRTE